MRPYCIELPNILPPWASGDRKSKTRHVWIDLDHVQLIEYEMHSAEVKLPLKLRELHPESDGIMTHSLMFTLTLAFHDDPMVLHGFEYRAGPSSLGLVAERLLAVWGMTS